MRLKQFAFGLAAMLILSPVSGYAAQSCILPAGTRPDLACTIPNNTLPNVLYVGGSVSINTTEKLKKAMSGTANICHIYANAGESNRGAECISEWLTKTAPGVKW